jgi:hypothetical protein
MAFTANASRAADKLALPIANDTQTQSKPNRKATTNATVISELPMQISASKTTLNSTKSTWLNLAKNAI